MSVEKSECVSASERSGVKEGEKDEIKCGMVRNTNDVMIMYMCLRVLYHR